jgi:hypothetical protein
MSKQKQRALALSEKITVLDKWKVAPPGMNQRELANHLQLPRSTLQKLIANETSLREEATSLGKSDSHLLKTKRNRKGKDVEMEDDETAIAETVSSKRPRVDEDVESVSNSDDEELPTAKPSETLKALHETERLLVRHGQLHLSGKLTEIVHAVKVVHNASLRQQDIRDFLCK